MRRVSLLMKALIKLCEWEKKQELTAQELLCGCKLWYIACLDRPGGRWRWNQIFSSWENIFNSNIGLCCKKNSLNSAVSCPGAPEEQQQQEGRSGDQWENQLGEYPVQCAFIPAVPCSLHPGCPHPFAGLSEPQQAAFWEPLLHLRLKRLISLSDKFTLLC